MNSIIKKGKNTRLEEIIKEIDKRESLNSRNYLKFTDSKKKGDSKGHSMVKNHRRDG